MLKDLNLPSLQVRRRENCLIFLYKIAAGLIPTIPAESFLTPVRNKRQIKTTSRSNFTSSNIIKRLCQKQQPLLLFGQCKNKTPTETASSSELFLTRTTGTGRRSDVCKVGGGISIPHLHSTLSALPVFPSTFMPGHGPSRRNYQDQDKYYGTHWKEWVVLRLQWL